MGNYAHAWILVAFFFVTTDLKNPVSHVWQQESITLKQRSVQLTPRIGSRNIEINIGGGGLSRNQK